MENITKVALIPWTEYVGKVISVTDNMIILKVIRHIPILIPHDVFVKSKSLLRKGQNIGILALDDGSIRIRAAELQQIDPKEVISN